MHRSIFSYPDYQAEYQHSVQNAEEYWGQVASRFYWSAPWQQVLQGTLATDHLAWYAGGTTNLAYNCLDRHLPSLAQKPAIIWESNNPDEPSHTYTYAQVHAEVVRIAALLAQQGVQAGDRVCIYMPMVPEAAFAMLACARLGAIHSIVFGGFSATSLADRLNDASCKLLVTADGTMRGNKEVNLKAIADEALAHAPSVGRVLVLRRTGSTVPMHPGRDLWLHEALAALPATHPDPMVQVDAEHPLFILYTSGSTGKPKGIVHATGGYMVYVGHTFANVFQLEPDDVYWCTADVGWITGHSYLLYGPLLNGATTLMFEGVPTWPDAGRFWEVVDKHKVSILYTAPTAIRALMAYGTEPLQGKDLGSLRLLGSVGEPINQEAWEWYHRHIGKGRCHIVDTWWQTETGGVMISPIAGTPAHLPTYAALPMPGIQPLLVDAEGKEIPWQPGQEIEGNLCIRYPWPSIARTTWGDHKRFRETYFSTYPGLYFTGDGCKRNADGLYRILGRVDDVINVSGHRIGTAEVENAVDEHPDVIETAVVGYPHDIKGQGIYAYVILEPHCTKPEAQLQAEVNELVVKVIGPIAKPDKLQVVKGLPKTRSGKIMRRILRKVAAGELDGMGDTSTLLDPAVVDEIVAGRK